MALPGLLLDFIDASFERGGRARAAAGLDVTESGTASAESLMRQVRPLGKRR